MPWSGTGSFSRLFNWQTDAANGVPITASRMQPDSEDMATNGFGNCLTRDGQGIATANLPMGSFRHTGVSDGQAATDYSSVGQVQRGSLTFAVGGGSGDAITATYAPAITVLTDGMTLEVRAPGTNTVTNPTFAPNGLTARTITKGGGAALAAGEYAANQILLLSYVLAGTRWELTNSSGLSAIANNRVLGNNSGSSALPSAITANQVLNMIGSTAQAILFNSAGGWTTLAPGTAGQVFRTGGAAANPAYADGALKAQKFTGSGTFTVPSNATAITVFKITVVGGGGGGGSGDTGVNAGGGGGGSGGVAVGYFSGFTASGTVTITVGAAGTAGSGSAGGTGGTSKCTYSAVDFISALGGVGGARNTTSAAAAAPGAAGSTSIPGGGGLTVIDSFSSMAAGGMPGFLIAGGGNFPLGGQGGNNPFGAGGITTVAEGIGAAGTQGGGGAGGARVANDKAGGAGGAGFVLIEWVL